MFLFKSPTRPETQWFCAGLTSSFPDVGEDDEHLSQTRSCNGNGPDRPGCKVFQVPKEAPAEATEVVITTKTLEQSEFGDELKDQVLVFQHRGKFHAVNHQCPHAAFPLSQGTSFDVEDFGVVLSAGITCPKHGWSFDVFTGMADRAQYKLKVWEVQLRDQPDASPNVGSSLEPMAKEVWVRQKQRLG